MSDEEQLRRKLQELIPRRDELLKKLESHGRRREQLARELEELRGEIAARSELQDPPPWPGTLEPLVLVAAYLVPGGDVDSIAEKVVELSSKSYGLPAIRSTVHRLVHRRFLEEDDRSFTITPQGERELAQARNDAKRWIEALGNLEGPARL